MRDFLIKAAAVAVMVACLGGLWAGLEKENARLGAQEMCDPGWNAQGPRAGIYYKIQHKDVLEFYTGSKSEKSLEELINFCKQIGFNPEK